MTRLRLIGIVGAVLLAVLTAVGAAYAGDGGSGGLPSFPKPKGTTCVENTQDMRRNHFEYLLHQRNATLRQGVRGAKYSLEQCVSCHAAEGKDGKAVPVNAEGQFCQSCHSYAAVSIDCFECHATTPDKAGARTAAR